MRLPANHPFRFDFALRYLARSTNEVLDVVLDGAHRRALVGRNGPILIELRAAEVDGSPGLEAAVLSGELCADELAAFVRRMHRLDDDRAALPDDEPLAAQLLAAFRGLPLVQSGSPFEALAWAILGQQINIAFAYRLKRRFVESYGQLLEHRGRTYFAFPDPERVALLSHEEHLLPIQFSRQKSRYVVALAQAICEGRLDLDAIALMDDEEALARLQEQVGVGRWTAEYALLRGYGRRDMIPAGDAGLKAVVGVHLGLPGHASEAQVRELAEAWRPYRGELAFMIWFALNNGWYRRPRVK
jgi:DNA-3-methyladenine glycosylase II